MIVLTITDFWQVADWFKSIGDFFKTIWFCIPDFLRPLCLAFVVISAIYLIAGRN